MSKLRDRMFMIYGFNCSRIRYSFSNDWLLGRSDGVSGSLPYSVLPKSPKSLPEESNLSTLNIL